MDLASVSHRLRVRPDILQAIEAADFARLPPRGYTRNMISAYARLVGLNPADVTTMYLDEVHAFESGYERVDGRREAEASASRRSRGQGSARTGRSTRSERSRRADAGGEESSRARSERRGRGGAGCAQPARFRSRRGSGEARASYVGGGSSYPSLYSSAQNGGAPSMGRLPLIIGAAVVLLVLIVVIVFVVGGNKGTTEEVPNVPISGLTDTSSPEGEASVEPVDVEPTSASVTYKVTGSSQIYAVITTDGVEEQKMISAPTEETVEVTGTWSFAAWAVDTVTVTVDGEKIDYTQDSGGMPVWTVDFTKIKEDWIAAHASSSYSAATTSSTSSSASSSSSSSRASSSASSSSRSTSA